MGVDLRRVEALLPHEGLGTVRRALAFAANAKQIDVVANDMGDIDRRRLMRECRQTDCPPRFNIRAASFTAFPTEHSTT